MQNSTIKDKLEKYFEIDKKTSIQIFNSLCLYIFQLESKDTDLYKLATILPEEDLIKLISYFDGEKMTIPSEEDYRRCKLLAFAFYMKEILGKSWKEIKEYLDFPDNCSDFISSISLGRRINQIRDNIIRDLVDGLKKVNFKDIKEVVDNERR